jgi:hypothetical protein
MGEVFVYVEQVSQQSLKHRDWKLVRRLDKTKCQYRLASCFTSHQQHQHPHQFFFSISIATMSNATRGTHGSQGSTPDGRKSAPPQEESSVFCLTCLGAGHEFQNCRAQCHFCKQFHNGGQCRDPGPNYYPFTPIPRQSTAHTNMLATLAEREAVRSRLQGEVDLLQSHLSTLLAQEDLGVRTDQPQPTYESQHPPSTTGEAPVVAEPKPMEIEDPDEHPMKLLFRSAGHPDITFNNILPGYNRWPQHKKKEHRDRMVRQLRHGNYSEDVKAAFQKYKVTPPPPTK